MEGINMKHIIEEIKSELDRIEEGVKSVSEEYALGFEFIYLKLMELENLGE